MEPTDPTRRPVVCKACGAENTPSRLFCSNCGAYLHNEEEDTWENLPAPQAPDDPDTPPSFLWEEPSEPPAAWDDKPPGSPPPLPRGPAPRRTRRAHTTALAAFLAVLLIAAMMVTGVVVYTTFFENSGDGETVNTTTTAATSSSTTVTTAGGSSTTQTTGNAPGLGAPVTVTEARASSELPPAGGNDYGATNLVDGDLNTCWSEGVEGPGIGEWVRVDLGRPVRLTAIEIANGYQKDSRRFEGNPRVRQLSVEYSDGTSQAVQLYDDMGFQIITPPPEATEWVRFRIESVYPGDTWEDTSLSEVRLYQASE